MTLSVEGKSNSFPILLCWSVFLAFIGVVVFIIGPIFLPKTNWNLVGVFSALFLAVPTLAILVKILYTYIQRFFDTRKMNRNCSLGGSAVINIENHDTKLPMDPKETGLSTNMSMDDTPPEYVLPPAYNK